MFPVEIGTASKMYKQKENEIDYYPLDEADKDIQ